MLGEVNGRWGKCKYFLKDEYVGRSVRNYGEYNPDETEKILELVGEVYTSDSVVLDIGANIGCISMALVSSGYNTMFFEPQPEIYKVAAENVHSLDGAYKQGYNLALGSSTGTVKMPKVAYSEKGNFGGLSIGVNLGRGTYDVQCTTLDEFMSNPYKTYNKVSFMKIDVEGYELEVLRGAHDTIMRDKPIMYIEDDRSDKSYALRKYIREELGYWIEEHKPTLYRERNFFDLKKNIWDKNYASHNIICRPS